MPASRSGLLILGAEWRRRGGWPGWPAVLVAARFRRLLLLNRDLFLRSLMLEAAFLVFTAIGSRHGTLILAANAILLNFFTAAAYGLDGFAHAAEAMIGRTVGARDRAGFAAAVRAGFVNAALLAALMTGLFWLVGPALIRLLTNLAEVRAAGHAVPALGGAAAAGVGVGVPVRRHLLRGDPHRRAAQRHGAGAGIVRAAGVAPGAAAGQSRPVAGVRSSFSGCARCSWAPSIGGRSAGWRSCRPDRRTGPRAGRSAAARRHARRRSACPACAGSGCGSGTAGPSS